MSDPFILLEPQDAHEYLHSFDAGTRSRGETYLREGRVSGLACSEPGIAYSASVRGTDHYDVELYYDEIEGWLGDCTCPLGLDCKHVYAAMKALLAEHSVAVVRGISSGAAVLDGKRAGRTTSAESASAPKPKLAEQVVAALGRPLRTDEAKYLHKISEIFFRCRNGRPITHWDFDDLGLSLGGYGWNGLKIWPAAPESEREFWLYVAKAAIDCGRTIPKFLEPVTNVSEIEDRLRSWKRQQDIARWNQMLQNVTVERGMEHRSLGVWDLRLVLGERGAHLEHKGPGQEQFVPFKQNQLNRFAEDYRNGVIDLPAKAEFLWHLFQSRLSYGHSPPISYSDQQSLKILGRALRRRAVADDAVNADGEPLVWVEEPLRWKLGPAQSEEDDYHLRLVQADGRPLPSLLCVLDGDPALYVTRNAVFQGPPQIEFVLNPMTDNSVPAPALETQGGVSLLRNLQVELPERLRERVREVPFDVFIHCELRPSYPGSKTENCLIRVTAESRDGQVREQWGGVSWTPAENRSLPRGKRQKADGTIPLYDRAALFDVPRLMEPLGLKWDGYQRGHTLRVTKKFPEAFTSWLKSLPPHFTVNLHGDLNTLAQEAVAGQVRLDVSESAIDWFDLRVVLDVSDTTLTPAEIKLLLDAKGGFVRLGEKGWRRLQFDLSEEDDERLARLGITPHELTSEPQRLHALQLADDAARKFLPEQQVEMIQRRAGEIKARVTPDLPARVTAELRPYQLDGFHFLAYLATNHFGGILADDMGLGKTLQTLVWLIWLRQGREARNADPAASAARATDGNGEPKTSAVPPSLVVCPKSVMDNWHAEAVRFTPGLRVKAWPPSELNQIVDRLNEADLHVLNYSQLRILGESLIAVPWQAVILDEGQYIKNPNSQTAQVARALRAEHRLVLSGTPIENRLLDLWSLLAFAMPGVLGSRAQFARMFDAKEDPLARRRLASRVRPFLLRRTKSQVAKELPDRVEEDLFCEIEGEQKTLYRAELKRAQQMLLKVKTQKQLAQERFHFLTSLLRLRQICCHPALVKADSQAASAKMEALLEQLEPLMDEGHKVLVFSQFVELLALLKPAIAARDWPMFYLAGETENRGQIVNAFQKTDGAAVFLISLKAGGFGLNLTAASYVVLFDPWWNPAVENQAIDRTHRIGQVNKVMAYRLLIKDSVEEKIRALQKQKSALAEDVLGEEKFSQSLSIEDLQFLFAD